MTHFKDQKAGRKIIKSTLNYKIPMVPFFALYFSVHALVRSCCRVLSSSLNFVTVESRFLEHSISWTSQYTRTKCCFLLELLQWFEHRNFIPDLSNSPISQNNFLFPWSFKKSELFYLRGHGRAHLVRLWQKTGLLIEWNSNWCFQTINLPLRKADEILGNRKSVRMVKPGWDENGLLKT